MLALTNTAEACSRKKRRPPPPPPPPPGSPPVPPTPPPIVKVIREREQVMTRNNCKQVQIDAKNHAALEQGEDLTSEEEEAFLRDQNKLSKNQCLNAENFQYVCEFTVYSEIALTVISHPTGCGCAFTISVVKPRPRAPDVAGLMSVNAAYSTKVTRFAIVVFDVEANQVEAEIPEFSNMVIDADTTALIEKQVGADPDGDFTTITEGFSGHIKEFPKLPKQLDRNNPNNKNFVPAIMFSIEQTYKTGAMFVVPCTLEMHTAPNAYVSVCQPYRADAPYAYSKRAALEADEAEAEPQAWFREFYLFPKQTNKCGSSGYEPKSRYITSFYNDPNCKHTHGYFSFDREFESEFTSSPAVVGGWTWERKFSETRVVFGVPHQFSPLTSVWCLGYSQINWASQSGFQPTDIPVKKGVCTKLPNANAWKSEMQTHKYKEAHPSFPIHPQVQCAPAFEACEKDSTLLGFQNRNPRDFSKKEDSLLLTGPRRAFCTQNSQEDADKVVFDTLTFRGVSPGQALAKRNYDDSLHKAPHRIHMVYDPELDGLVHGRHAPHLVHAVNKVLRKRAEKEMFTEPVAAAPHRDNFGLNMAAGSVDAKGLDSKDAGDHPIRKFPETYAAPLTLDPVTSASDAEPTVYDAEETTGLAPPKFCDIGDIGCTCRKGESAQGACDAPYECNQLGYCVPPACPRGEAGCPAHVGSDKPCDGSLVVSSDGMCIFEPACEKGKFGCVCGADDACEAGGECLDGRCLRAVTEGAVCAPGEPGCECTEDGSCSEGASCDTYAGVCLFESCLPGSPGCRCESEGAPCDTGYVCNPDGACVEAGCTPGSAGCKCLPGKECNKRGFTCVELDRSGAQSVCVGQKLCGFSQTDRCNDECGVGNVASCGQCRYSRPICRDPTVQYCNPDSYLFGVEPCEAGASTMILSLAALVAAFL